MAKAKVIPPQVQEAIFDCNTAALSAMGRKGQPRSVAARKANIAARKAANTQGPVSPPPNEEMRFKSPAAMRHFILDAHRHEQRMLKDIPEDDR